MKMIFFVLPLIYIGANCYLFIRTLQAFSWLPLWAKVVLSIVFWVVVFSLNHQPYSLAETDSLKVDLLLCGHTHRGQVFPLNLITDKLYEQSHGYRKWSYSHIWVSSGLSLWGPPFRIGTQSDFAVIDIKKYKQNN